MDKQLVKIIEQALEAGEIVPDGVYLVGSRAPTQAEIEYGLSLASMAEDLLSQD